MPTVTDLFRQLHADGVSYRQIAERFGVGKSTVGDIVTGKTQPSKATVAKVSAKMAKESIKIIDSTTKTKTKRMGYVAVWRKTDEYIEFLNNSKKRKVEKPIFFNVTAVPDGYYEFDFERYSVETNASTVIVFIEPWKKGRKSKLSTSRENQLREALKAYGADWRTENDIVRDVNYILQGKYNDRHGRKRAQLQAVEKPRSRAALWEKLPPAIRKNTTKERFLETGDLGFRANKVLTKKEWEKTNFGFWKGG